jgi:hypothetical protein
MRKRFVPIRWGCTESSLYDLKEIHMNNKSKITKTLAILGTILVWFPLLLPFIFGAIHFLGGGKFLIDFLIPAELFFLPLSGSLALLWAAVRAKSRRGWIGWSLAAILFFLVISQVVAVVTGLADGRVQVGGWQSTLVFGLYGGFLLALILIAVGGIFLLRDLYKKTE